MTGQPNLPTAAVQAVMREMGCREDRRGFAAGVDANQVVCVVHHNAMVVFGGVSGRVAAWTHSGCPVAVSVAAAVVAALDVDGRVREAKAEALDEAADAVEDDCNGSADDCFCTSAHWLRARAAELRKEAGQ